MKQYNKPRKSHAFFSLGFLETIPSPRLGFLRGVFLANHLASRPAETHALILIHSMGLMYLNAEYMAWLCGRVPDLQSGGCTNRLLLPLPFRESTEDTEIFLLLGHRVLS